MSTIPTWVKKITFELKHPANKDHRLVRTLQVSDTIHIPDGFTAPTHQELGFVHFDYRDPQDYGTIHDIIVNEVIRSKTDGLPPDAVSAVIRTTKESSFQIITTATERLSSKWVRRFAIKLKMPGDTRENLFFGGRDMPVYHFVGGEWTGIGDPAFYDTCVYVGKVVAVQNAQNILRDWKAMGFDVCPEKVDVQEVCYARQTIQLVSEVQRDALAGGVTAFGSRSAAEFELR